jgi:ubiquinol-cytochrome c reductase cytochrome b subunit
VPKPETNEPEASGPKAVNLPSRLFRWLDKRTGVHEIMKESLDEPIPGGARLAYVFGSGLLFIFISQIITGLCLALYYVPSAETAHTSVAYITKQVAAGSFLRSLHYYGSSAMIVVLALHFLQTFLYGSFKGRRELLWISGAVLSFLVLGMGFTGYLLPWDQKAYFATAIGTNIVGEVPFIGNWLTRLLRGGDTIGTLTLSRFYVAHVFLIPAAIMGFIGAHILLFRKAGPAGPIEEDPITPKMAPEGFYPRQVLMDMAFALLIMMGLGVLAYFHPVALGPVADPSNTQFLPRPEWYYLSFFLMPFLDRSLERRPWRRPIPVLAVAIVLVGMVYLGMRSRSDDKRDPAVAAQLAIQEEQEKAYGKEPFEPYIESPGGTAVAAALPSGPANPLVAHGRAIFEAHGCAACHGVAGVGAIAPALVGIATKLPGDQLHELLLHPNAAMNAGHMPAVDMSADDMSALLAYIDVLGTAAANAPASPGHPASEASSATTLGTSGAAGFQPVSGGPPVTRATEAGQQIFAQRGCAVCHGASGEGGRAPAMASLISGHSDGQVLEAIQTPNAKMKAGGMQAVTGTPAELTSLIAYVRTLGGGPSTKPALTALALTQTEQGPAQPAGIAASASSPQAIVAAGAAAGAAPVAAQPVQSDPGHAVFVSQGCAACHGVNAGGTHFAPALVGISGKFPGEALPNLLHHPDAKMKAGGMPPVTANAAEMKQLLAYLTTLGTVPSAPSPVSAGRMVAATSPSAGSSGIVSLPSPPAKPLSELAVKGSKVFEHYSCQTCHGAGGLNGTVAAPGLAGTASILPAATLENLLRHHSIQMQNGNMPPTTMNSNDMRAVIAFIREMPQTFAVK